jgi:hypothetical protein
VHIVNKAEKAPEIPNIILLESSQEGCKSNDEIIWGPLPTTRYGEFTSLRPTPAYEIPKVRLSNKTNRAQWNAVAKRESLPLSKQHTDAAEQDLVGVLGRTDTCVHEEEEKVAVIMTEERRDDTKLTQSWEELPKTRYSPFNSLRPTPPYKLPTVPCLRKIVGDIGLMISPSKKAFL